MIFFIVMGLFVWNLRQGENYLSRQVSTHHSFINTFKCAANFSCTFLPESEKHEVISASIKAGVSGQIVFCSKYSGRFSSNILVNFLRNRKDEKAAAAYAPRAAPNNFLPAKRLYDRIP